MFTIFKEFLKFLPKKFFTKVSKIWVWDPGSRIRDWGSRKTYSGSQIQGSKRHQIPDLDPQHCYSDIILRLFYNNRNIYIYILPSLTGISLQSQNLQNLCSYFSTATFIHGYFSAFNIPERQSLYLSCHQKSGRQATDRLRTLPLNNHNGPDT